MQKPKMDKKTEMGVEKLENAIDEMKKLTVDSINEMAEEPEFNPQTFMSRTNFEKYDAPVIKPTKSFSTKSKPHPKEAKERKRGWELIKCIAENHEIKGDPVVFWYNKFLGDPIFYWEVPVNVPVYLPRFVAEYLSTRNYHKFVMQDRSGREFMVGKSSGDEQMVVKESIRRIDCRHVGFGF